MANYQYCVAKNWGKGFITPKDSRTIGSFTSFMGDLWKVPANNQDANSKMYILCFLLYKI